jgi:hypothetical protein
MIQRHADSLPELANAPAPEWRAPVGKFDPRVQD